MLNSAVLVFFFSSRRRHTRYWRDWSSDVCSSDLMDGQTHVSDQATIWRWREAFQHDFAARMDWTVRPFAAANHNPVPGVNGSAGTAPIFIDAPVGSPVALDARGSRDPYGNQLRYP